MAEVDFPEKAQKVISILLIIGAVALYVGWGIAYGSWNLFEPSYIPIYAIVVVMLLFGGLGLLLLKNKD
jgi:TRAP-type C4-dicarboxylate transport system permease small subunit